MKIIDIAYHRNGLRGIPFYVTVFNDGTSIKLAILFDTKAHCAVFDFEKLLTGNIRVGENSYPGDHFEKPLRKAIRAHFEAQK